MPQPRRYKLNSWDAAKGEGIAIDGTLYEGEFIEFVVRGVDLDPDYNGYLVRGEEFYANESPNHLLYDVVVETGPRGLISQTNFEAQRAARVPGVIAIEPTPMTEHLTVDMPKLTEPVTMTAEELETHRQQLVEELETHRQQLVEELETHRQQLNEQERFDAEQDGRARQSIEGALRSAKGVDGIEIFRQDEPGKPFIQTAYLRQIEAEDVSEAYVDPLRAHVEHLEELLTNLKRETNLIVAYLNGTSPSWREIAKIELDRMLMALGISVAHPEPSDVNYLGRTGEVPTVDTADVYDFTTGKTMTRTEFDAQKPTEKVDEFSSDVDDPSPEASGQAL